MRLFVLLALLLTCTGCDHGLEPPDAVPEGAIRGTITYTQGTAHWPTGDSLRDLRFFALPFVPQDTLDLFRDLNVLVFSDRLAYRVLARHLITGHTGSQDLVAGAAILRALKLDEQAAAVEKDMTPEQRAEIQARAERIRKNLE